SDAHVTVQPGWLDPLIDELDEPEVGMVAPAIFSGESNDEGGFGRTWKNPDLEWLWLRRADTKPYAAPLLSGCFIAAKRHMLNDLGGFDPGFRVWGEEGAELC